MGLEVPRELRLVAEPPAVGNLCHRHGVGGVGECLAAGFEALVPDPASDRLVGVAEKFVEIAGGHAAAAGDGLGRQFVVAEIAADEALDAGEMRDADARRAARERALVGPQRQHQKIDELQSHSVTCFGRHGVEARWNEMEHVGEETACTFRRIELQRAEAVGLADAAAQRLGLDLQDPEIGGLAMAELIGLVAALEDEASGLQRTSLPHWEK